jgi:para-nitrobenzyl esterase
MKSSQNPTLPAAAADGTCIVRIDSGLVQGHLHRGPEPTLEFKGIPYAATTGGANRFRPPQPRAPWGDRIWVADRMGPDCLNPQQGDGIFGGVIDEPRYMGETIGPGSRQAEDSLFLSIWTPAADGARRPVMLWVHGGGLRVDSSNRPPYVGNHLAYRGNVVVVTLNYRLGGVGMLAHRALRSADTGHFANWNIQDWLCALRWIQRNITQFGGSPGNVTVFGESGGSVGVNNLALIDHEIRDGLFHRVIGQSGDPVQSTLEQHERAAERLFEKLGCSPETALESLREADLATFKSVTDEWSRAGLWPVTDGLLLRHAGAAAAIEAGETEGLDWMIGSNGPGWDVGTALSWQTLLEHSRRGGRAYRYYLPSSPGVEGVHGADIPLVFGTYEDKLGVLTESSERGKGLVSRDHPAAPRLSARMIRAWSHFAWTGDPSFEDEELGRVRWPVYRDDSFETMIWDDKPHVDRREPVTDITSRPRRRRPERAPEEELA